jgi:hypothetical protein
MQHHPPRPTTEARCVVNPTKTQHSLSDLCLGTSNNSHASCRWHDVGECMVGAQTGGTATDTHSVGANTPTSMQQQLLYTSVTGRSSSSTSTSAAIIATSSCPPPGCTHTSSDAWLACSRASPGGQLRSRGCARTHRRGASWTRAGSSAGAPQHTPNKPGVLHAHAHHH